MTTARQTPLAQVVLVARALMNDRFAYRFHRIAAAVAAVGSLWLAISLPSAAAATPRNFDIAAGSAAKSLKQYSAQSGEQLLYSNDDVAGVTTKAVKGLFTPPEALDLMLAGTPLASRRDERNGTVAVTRQGVSEKNVPRAAPPIPSDRPERNREGPSASDERTIELSPFVVSASQDVGYLARNTLGGTRLDTPLADVASQVSVMTSEFLEDIAATSLEDALLYSLNVETMADFASTTGGGNGFDFAIFNDDLRSRTRGLEQSTLTQEFFVSNVRQDTYNAERITVASGPNAILFGLGSPAGLIDSGPKRAQLEQQSYTVSFRADDRASLRSTIDLNVPLVRRYLAARMVLLKDNENQFPIGSGKDDRRAFGAVTFRPFKRTELRLSYEDAAINTLPARPILIRDGVTPWIAAGKPLFDNSGITPTSVASLTTNRINALGLGSVFSRAPNAATGQFVMAIGATDPSVRNVPLYWAGTVLTRGPESTRLAPDNIAGTLADSTIFPWGVHYEGNSTRNDMTSHTARALLEQNLFDRVFLQLGYNEERKVQRILSMANGAPLLNADANLYLPDGRTPNPNVGRYFIQSTGRYRGSRQLREREDWRISASTVLNMEERSNWLKWLGRHRLSTVFSREESRGGGSGYDLKAISPSAAAAALGITAARPGVNDSSGIAVRAYVEDPRDPKNHGIFSRQLSFDPFKDQMLPDGTTISTFDCPAGAAGTTLTKSLLKSQMLALQSYWWKGRIITTLGWRRDHQRTANFTLPFATFQPPLEQALGSPDFPNYDFDASGGTRNEGIVMRPFKWLSLHYSKSATFAPGINGLDAHDNIIPGSHGEGLDRGITLTPFGDTVYLRVNYYENSSGPRVSSFQSSVFDNTVGGIANIERSVRAAGALAAPGLFNPVDREGDLIPYKIDTKTRSKGIEAELIANPTPYWRLSVSVAKTRAEESEIGKSWIAYVHERAPVWLQYANAPRNTNPDLTVGSSFANLVNNISLMQQSDGQKVESGRDWRVRATTRYMFHQGWLKSTFIGGSYLWSSPNVAGFKTADFPNSFPELGGPATIRTSDVNQPIRGNAQSSLDVFAGYGRKLARNRIGWRVQLNVRNVLSDDTILIRQVLSDGSPLNFNLPAPRLFILTNTFTY